MSRLGDWVNRLLCCALAVLLATAIYSFIECACNTGWRVAAAAIIDGPDAAMDYMNSTTERRVYP